MFHKLEDGDIIKILPFINKNGSISPYKEYHQTNSNGVSGIGAGWKTIVDTECKYLKRMSFITNKNKLVQVKYAFNIYINGEIKVLRTGRSIFKMISEVLDIRNNLHLHVKLNLVTAAGISYDTYDKSSIIEYDWIPPVSDVNSKEEWENFIKNNQPNFEEYLEVNNVYKNTKLLDEIFGKNDILASITSDNRDKKIEPIL